MLGVVASGPGFTVEGLIPCPAEPHLRAPKEEPLPQAQRRLRHVDVLVKLVEVRDLLGLLLLVAAIVVRSTEPCKGQTCNA